jgi:hypothetical protein
MRARAILRIFEEMEASHLRLPEINSGEGRLTFRTERF